MAVLAPADGPLLDQIFKVIYDLARRAQPVLATEGRLLIADC
jgi:hypothetical protein